MSDDRQPLLPGPAQASSSLAALNASDKPPSRYSGFRRQLAYALDTPAFHWTIIGLSLLDFIFVMCAIGYEYLKDQRCLCDDSCEEDVPVMEILDLLSIFITGLFVLEIPLDLIAFGISHYTTATHWPLHCFDAVVVVVAFVVEVGVKGPLEEIASLLIILRLWRLIKLVSTLEVGMTEYREQAGDLAEIEAEREKERKAWAGERARWREKVEGLKRRVRALEGRREGDGGSSAEGSLTE
ncbi:hypothetical protein JCM21900_002410 [Sporobolomyces salmonicolor]